MINRQLAQTQKRTSSEAAKADKAVFSKKYLSLPARNLLQFMK
jgi:hypothetical protein